MAIKKLGKAAAALALVVGLTAAMAGQASAATVTWNGVRGLDSIGPCAPGEADGFHWILTPGGTNSVTAATLTFEGEVAVGTQAGDGAWHFFTHGSDDPGGASVETVGTPGRNALLTISDGCFGEETES